MTGRLIGLLVGYLLLGAVATSSAAMADEPIVVRDLTQHELRLEHSPRRIITLMPPLTEIVCALDECARLVATDRYSDWPDSVKALPKAGGLDDPQIERILLLKPDVVIFAHATQVANRLRQLGVPTFEVKTETYADLSRTIVAIGMLLGIPERAAQLNHDIERSLATVARTAKRSLGGRAPLVYYEVDNGPYSAGPDSFIGWMLAQLGARNIVGADLGPFPRLNPEYVVVRNPDVIFASPAEAPNLAHRAGWAQIRAVEEKRICVFSRAVEDTIEHAGPRMPEGLRALADCLIRMSP
jgi:iron complex transport system substrate-binding protein